MSVLYSILKPIVKLAMNKEKRLSMTRDEFMHMAEKIQDKFEFSLPRKKGYEFRDEMLGQWHCIVAHKEGAAAKRALMYLVGGGSARWQIPDTKTITRYIDETGRDMWIPLYPLYPDYNFLDEVEMIYSVYKNMLKHYEASDIAFLGFSAGANLALSLGRHIIQRGNEVPMPGIIIPVSCCNMYISEESYKRMEEIDKCDIMLPEGYMKKIPEFYDPDRLLPKYVMGCAKEDDYTGFPKTILYFGGDEIFAGEAPAYEKAFKRCGMKDYVIHIETGLFHGYPMFTFLKEGRQGENEIINYLR